MKDKTLLLLLLCQFAYPLSFLVGGKRIKTGHKLDLLENKSEQATPELLELQENNKKLKSLLKSNSEAYKNNPEELKKIEHIISKNDAKIKKLRLEQNVLEYKKNKDEKSLVSGFASFLDSCGANIDECKSEGLKPCHAQYNEITLFKENVASKKECLQLRKNLIKSKKLEVISLKNFKDDIGHKKVVSYSFDKDQLEVSEVNNCLLIATKNSHDREVLNTYSSDKESCIKLCKEEYLRSFKSYENGAISCHLLWNNENHHLLSIVKEKSSLFKIWTDSKLNSSINNDSIILTPMFNKNKEFSSFKQIMKK